MTEKYGNGKYRVYDWVKFDYSEIGEYIDENHTDKPLRNDEIVDLLNSQKQRIDEQKEIILIKDKIRMDLLKENEQLKSENKILKEDLEHCANQFTDDGKNILLSLR